MSLTTSNIMVIDERNEIYFDSDISNGSISMLIESLLTMENKIISRCKMAGHQLDTLLKDDKVNEFSNIKIEYNPIKLFITSDGGTLYSVLSVMDTIYNMKVPVYTICKGLVASAGTILSLCGKKRYITKNAFMLIHQISTCVMGNYRQLKDGVNNVEVLMDHLKRIYLEKTKINEEDLDNYLKHDVIWNSTICLEKGLVDEII